MKEYSWIEILVLGEIHHMKAKNFPFIFLQNFIMGLSSVQENRLQLL